MKQAKCGLVGIFIHSRKEEQLKKTYSILLNLEDNVGLWYAFHV